MIKNLDDVDHQNNPIESLDWVWMQVGKITGIFAKIEGQLARNILDLLGCDDRVGRVLVGGKRWDDLWKLLIDLMSAMDFEPHLMKRVQLIASIAGKVKKFRIFSRITISEWSKIAMVH